MTTFPTPIILNGTEAEEAMQILREIAEQAIPGEPGFARYFAVDSIRFIKQIRRAMQLLGQSGLGVESTEHVLLP